MTFYVIYYSDLGTPKTGLSPVIDVFIKVSDGTSAGTPPTVTELSGGFYRFEYNPTEEVAIRVDSQDTNMADADRYITLIASPEDDELSVISTGIEDIKGTGFVKDRDSLTNIMANPDYPVSGAVLALYFREGAGTKVYDLSPNRNHGTISGATWEDSVGGKRLRFDGSDDYVSVPNHNTLRFGDTTDFSGEAWVNIPSDLNSSIASIFLYKGNSGLETTGKVYYCFYTYQDKLQFKSSDGNNTVTWSGSTTLPRDTDIHVGFVFDRNGEVALYVNGAAETVTRTQNAGSGNPGDINTTAPLYLARTNGATNYFKGTIRDVRIYDSLLSASDFEDRYIFGYRSIMLDTYYQTKQIIEDLTDIKGTGFVKDTDSLVNIRTETDKIQTIDDNVDAIKLKTDNLPSDPASQSSVEAAITASEGNIRGTDNDTLKTLSEQLDTIDVNIDILIKIETGRWKIDTSTHEFIIYDSDGVTELYRFSLKDASGNPSSESVYERVPKS